ncbi:hypothetical protein Angca_000425, partial [Angiostrongylus cantonensis]
VGDFMKTTLAKKIDHAVQRKIRIRLLWLKNCETMSGLRIFTIYPLTSSYDEYGVEVF